MDRYIIDRFENDYAVCEDESKSMVNIKISELPSCAKEGDCIVFSDNKYELDLEHEEERTKTIKDKIHRIFK